MILSLGEPEEGTSIRGGQTQGLSVGRAGLCV